MGGKTGKWLTLFLKGKKEKDKSTTSQASVDLSLSPFAIQSTPPTREKKRWSFRRYPDSLNSTNPPPRQHLPTIFDSDEEQKKHAKDVAAATAAAAEAAAAAAQASAALLRLTNSSAAKKLRNNRSVEEAASIKIQSYFRSYLARKALRALRGLVKLQALVRGHLTRKRAAATLRCIQSLVNAQFRARAYRMKNYYDINSKVHKTTGTSAFGILNKCHWQDMEENIKIVEMDYGSKTRKSYGSPSSSAITEMGLIEYGGQQEQEEYSFNTAQSSSYCDSAVSMPDNPRGPFSLSHDYPPYPNYMANTESSRAKVRSHSAPKQRPDSFEKQMSRRRASVELRNPLRMNRSSHGQDLLDLFTIKFFSPSASVMASECGSSSTVLTANANYDKSRLAFK